MRGIPAEEDGALIDDGAMIVGGCCEVGPAHIAELSRRLDDAGLRRVRLTDRETA